MSKTNETAIYILIAALYTFAATLSSIQGENHVLSFPSIQQIRFVRVKQALPHITQKSLYWSSGLFVIFVPYYLHCQSFRCESNLYDLFLDIAVRQILATFVIDLSAHVYHTIATERVDFLRLIQIDPNSPETKCAILLESLPSDSAPTTEMHFQVWNCLNTVTQFDHLSCQEFYQNMEAWGKVSTPCFRVIQGFMFKLGQYTQKLEKSPPKPDSLLFWKNAKDPIFDDFQIVVWAIQVVTRLMVNSKTADLNGILQLHDQLELVIDILTTTLKTVKAHIRFVNPTDSFHPNFQKVHIIASELTSAIYLLRNTFNASLGKLQFQNAEILQEFADYQVP